MSPADYRGKQFGPRLFDILMLFLKDFVFKNLSLKKISRRQNQRTNGPVNAHRTSGATVSTKKIHKIWHRLKIGQGQLGVIIYINFVELEYILLHAKFHDHRTISSVGDFLKFLPYMSMAAILVM